MRETPLVLVVFLVDGTWKSEVGRVSRNGFELYPFEREREREEKIEGVEIAEKRREEQRRE